MEVFHVCFTKFCRVLIERGGILPSDSFPPPWVKLVLNECINTAVVALWWCIRMQYFYFEGNYFGFEIDVLASVVLEKKEKALQMCLCFVMIVYYSG